MTSTDSKKVLVVVLGELARSPRMQNHCISLSDNGYTVTVLATRPPTAEALNKSCKDLENNHKIEQHHMADAPSFIKCLPSYLAYLIKPIWQLWILLYTLVVKVDRPDLILVQNPPSIPTLPVLWLYSCLTGCKSVIDWHNYGYSILALKLKFKHPLVRLAKAIEIWFGGRADAGYCVSKAMKQDLIDNFGVTYPIQVLYDKPPKRFYPLNLREKHNFFMEIKYQFREFNSQTEDCFNRARNIENERYETRFTYSNKDVVLPNSNRSALIISSTSWTEDEDFGILFEALTRYNRARNNQLISMSDGDDSSSLLPDLVCVITGKGPLKEYYREIISKSSLAHVDILLPWLEPSEYAKMVAASDLGICLHKSSSGVDLPMKVVDMFGCGIPVLAYKYKAIDELVIEDSYGLTFNDADDLMNKLVLLLKDINVEDSRSRDNAETSALCRYRKNIRRHYLLSRWEGNWQRKAQPLLQKLLK